MISLTPIQSLLACCLVLVIGRVLTPASACWRATASRSHRRRPAVRHRRLPAISNWGGVGVSLDTSIRPTLLLLFFGCIGLTANLKLLAKGGPD